LGSNHEEIVSCAREALSAHKSIPVRVKMVLETIDNPGWAPHPALMPGARVFLFIAND
jgi:hypothetical protein